MKHLIIPDTQVKPNTPTDHLKWAGQYATEKKPDVIVHIGDHWDMESLSSYDKGKKSFEGRRYTKDIDSGITAMQTFLKPIRDEQARLKRNKEKIVLVFRSKSFLQQQVRSMVGSLKYLGEGKWNLNDFTKAFNSKKRTLCAPPAPAHGLI